MPKAYPAEFRYRAVALVRARKPVTAVAPSLGVSEGCLHNWVRQDRVDHGKISGITTRENAELKAARKRIRELEREVEILQVAASLLGEDKPRPKGFRRSRRRRASSLDLLSHPGRV